MGSYLNPGSKGFQESLNSEIYVDKTGLIEKTNMDGLQEYVNALSTMNWHGVTASDIQKIANA